MIFLIKRELKKIIKEKIEIEVFPSEKPEFGHYSTNVAFKLAKTRISTDKKSPMEIAEELATSIMRQAAGIFEKVEMAPPGFVNFWLKPEVFQKELEVILKNKNKYGRNNNLKGQKTIVEYTDPNPFKEFHIGHLMSNSIGETLSRIIEWNGAEVKRACYQGDVGMHVAKAIWGFINGEQKAVGFIKDCPEVFIWGNAYARGAKAYESDEKAKKEINEINRKVYSRSDKEINRLYDIGRKASLESFESIYKKLGTKFNYYFFESETGKRGRKIVEDHIKNGVFEKSEGAVIFKGEKYGLHTRVFINSEGLPTYEAKELGLAEIKYKKYHFDKSIVVTANEINDYFKVVLKAMGIVLPKLAAKIKHLSHGMLRLPTGKMSSRTGEAIAALSLIGNIEKLVASKIKDRDINQNEKEKIEESVAIGAIKYSILKQAIGGDVIFDFDKSISFEGDSGPYLQYAHTRAKSILIKAKEQKIKPSLEVKPQEITEVEKLLCRFPEIVEKAGMDFAPNYIVSYLMEVARAFNGYYEKNRIVDIKENYSPYRTALTSALEIIMSNGLKILGIPAPGKM